jgi:hypothetical protein
VSAKKERASRWSQSYLGTYQLTEVDLGSTLLVAVMEDMSLSPAPEGLGIVCLSVSRTSRVRV